MYEHPGKPPEIECKPTYHRGKKKVYSTVPYKSEPNNYQTSFSILCRVLVGPETPFVEKLNVLPSYPRHDILITGTRVPAGRNGEVIEDTE